MVGSLISHPCYGPATTDAKKVSVTVCIWSIVTLLPRNISSENYWYWNESTLWSRIHWTC